MNIGAFCTSVEQNTGWPMGVNMTPVFTGRVGKKALSCNALCQGSVICIQPE